MNEHQLNLAAGVSVPSALIAWFAETLPVIQGMAGVVAIIVGGMAIWNSAGAKRVRAWVRLSWGHVCAWVRK